MCLNRTPAMLYTPTWPSSLRVLLFLWRQQLGLLQRVPQTRKKSPSIFKPIARLRRFLKAAAITLDPLRNLVVDPLDLLVLLYVRSGSDLDESIVSRFQDGPSSLVVVSDAAHDLFAFESSS